MKGIVSFPSSLSYVIKILSSILFKITYNSKNSTTIYSYRWGPIKYSIVFTLLTCKTQYYS